MSVKTRAGGIPVHYPKNPNKFSFDSEVSKIFPDMAKRSIPLYEEAHRVHVELLKETLRKPMATILDIGASRGHFLKEVCAQTGCLPKHGRDGLRAVAIDTSTEMLRLLKEEMPWVETYEGTAQNLNTVLPEPLNADVVCLFYVLQFIEGSDARHRAIKQAFRHLRPGGVLIIGQKEEVPDRCAGMFTEAYYAFRMANGYTMDEIKAKTAALKNSMWVDTRSAMETSVYVAGFDQPVETTRWLQFATYMARKPD